MKHLVVAIIIALTLNIGKAHATNIRGQIVRYVNGRYYPLPNVRVDFMVWNGQAWVLSAYAITGADGFYYFINFAPGVTFCVSVLGRFYPLKPLITQNLAPQFYQDVPVIAG
jgi:hypothetical protein